MLQNAPTSPLLPSILQCTYNSKSITIRQETETTKKQKIKKLKSNCIQKTKKYSHNYYGKN